METGTNKPLDYLDQHDVEILRQRVFDLERTDDSRDEDINKLSPIRIAKAFCGWELGDDSWIDYFIMWCASATGKDEEEIKDSIFR